MAKNCGAIDTTGIVCVLEFSLLFFMSDSLCVR